MPYLGILYLLFIAVLITLIFSILMRIKGPWGNVWIFFLIALLLAATTPSPRTRTKILEDENEKAEKKAEADFYSLGIFFWVLFLVMLVLLAIGLFATV